MLHISALIQLLIWMLIYIPLTIYQSYLLWVRRHHVIFQKRSLALLALMIVFLSLSYTQLVFFNQNYHGELMLIAASDSFTKMSNTAILDGLYIVFVVRGWLLYFKLRWSEAMMNSAWKTLINKEKVRNNFFIKYKSSAIGSFHKMRGYILVFYFLLTSVSAFIIFYDSPRFGMFNGIHLTSILLVQMVIICKTPDDAFKIRTEMIIHLVIWFLTGLYFGVIIPMGLSERFICIGILSPYVTLIASLGMSCAAILYPIYHFEIRKTSDESHLQTQSFPSTWTAYVCESRKNFDQFMVHLSKEFAVENLCFVLEGVQFKTKYKPHNHYVLDFTKPQDFGFHLALPSHLPQSEIIGGDEEDSHKPLDAILAVYQKYIDNGADLQINISHDARVRMDKIVGKIREKKENVDWDILLFDQCLREVAQLVNDSYRRYLRSLL